MAQRTSSIMHIEAGPSSTTLQESPATKMRSEDAQGIKLARLLLDGATAIEDGDIMEADTILKSISELSLPTGNPLQRAATYFYEALVLRLRQFLGVPRALRPANRLSALEKVQARRLFGQLCPFMMFSWAIANVAIGEAMRKEEVIHVIDLNACDPQQWILLLHTLKQQRQGRYNNNNKKGKGLIMRRLLPKLKISGIHEKNEVLEEMEFQLKQVAQNLGFDEFEFCGIVESKLEDLNFERLNVKKEEALAVTSVLQLHSLLATDDDQIDKTRPSTSPHAPPGTSMDPQAFAEWIVKFGIQASPNSSLSPLSSQCASPKIEWFLQSLRNLQPKLVVITEQECNANETTWISRFQNVLKFYCAQFDYLEANVSKARATDRIIMERLMFGEEIKNIVACEGIERVERHEKAETWAHWLQLVGFHRFPMDYGRMSQATRPLESFGHGYKLKERDQCLFTCWNDQELYSISLWQTGENN